MSKITDIVTELARPVVQQAGCELWDVEYVKEAGQWFLRVYIDKAAASEEMYVSTDDCEKVSRYLSDRLDEEDPIEQNYYLEVSSPGLDRQLYEQKDFDRFTGSVVDVKLYKSVGGRKEYQGVLEGLKDGVVMITAEGDQHYEFPMDQVAKVNLAVIF